MTRDHAKYLRQIGDKMLRGPDTEPLNANVNILFLVNAVMEAADALDEVNARLDRIERNTKAEWVAGPR